MDSKIRDQIKMMLDNNNINSKKINYHKINNDTYKMTFDGLFITYIIIDNNIHSAQAKNWRAKREDVVGYIRSLDNIRVMTVIDIVDDTTVAKCVNNIKLSHILLLITDLYEQQLAIDNNIDYYYTFDRTNIGRFTKSFNFIRRQDIDYVMFLNSNDIIPKKWVEKAICDNNDIIGKDSRIIIDNGTMYKNTINHKYVKDIGMGDILLLNGLLIKKKVFIKNNWNIRSATYNRDILLSIFDILTNDISISKIKCGDIVTIITDKSIDNIHDIRQNRVNIIKKSKDIEAIEDIYRLDDYGKILCHINKGIKIKVIPPKIKKKNIEHLDKDEINSNRSGTMTNILIVKSKQQIIKKYPIDNIIEVKSPVKSRKHIKGGNASKATIKPIEKKKLKSTLVTPQQVKQMIKNDNRRVLNENSNKEENKEDFPNFLKYSSKDVEYMMKRKINSRISDDNDSTQILKDMANIKKHIRGTNPKPNDKSILPDQNIVNDMANIKKHVRGSNPKPNDKSILPDQNIVNDMANIKKHVKGTTSKPEIKIIDKDLPIKSNTNDKDIRLMLNNKSDTTIKNFNYDTYKNNFQISNIYEIPKIISNRTYSEISTRDNCTIMTIIIVNDIGYSMNTCIKYLQLQTVCTDILLILDKENHVNNVKRMGYFYIVSDNNSSLHSKILYGLSYVKKLNYKYIMILDSSTILSETWLEEGCKLIGNGIDCTGSDSIYFLSENKLFYTDRDGLLFWYGRIFSTKLLHKLNWNPLDNVDMPNINISLSNKLESSVPINNAYILSLHDRKGMYNICNSKPIETNIIQKVTSYFYDIIYKSFNAPINKLKNGKHKAHRGKNEILDKGDKVGDYDYPVQISIVLPTFKGYPHIKNAISDIKAQKFKDWELIIVNDGSCDNALEKYLDSIRSKKIHVVTHDINKGLPSALNTGIRHSKGKYWCWTSDDNKLLPDFLQKLKNMLDRGYDFVYSDYTYIDSTINQNAKVYMKLEYTDTESIINNWKGMPSCMWRKDIVDKIGYYDINIQGCEDYEYVLKTFIAVNNTKICKIPLSLFTYYKRNNTLTTRLGNKQINLLKTKTNAKYINIYKEINLLLQKSVGNVAVVAIKDKNKYFSKGVIMYNILKSKYNTILLDCNEINVFNITVSNFNVSVSVLVTDILDDIYITSISPYIVINLFEDDVSDHLADFTTFRKINRISPKPLFITDKPTIGYITDNITNTSMLYELANNTSIRVVIITTDPKDISHNNISVIRDTSYDNIKRFSSWFSLCLTDGNIPQFLSCMATGKIVISMSTIQYLHNPPHYYIITKSNCNEIINNILSNCDLRKIYTKNIKYANLMYNTNNPLNRWRINYTIIYPPLISYDHLKQRPSQLIKSFSHIPNMRAIFFDKYPIENKDEYISNNMLILGEHRFKHVSCYTEGKVIYYYTFPNDIKHIQYIKPNFTIYDLIDNPTDEFKHWMGDNLVNSIQQANLFVSSAQIMYDKYSSKNANSIIVSNGCDYDHFNRVLGDLDKPADFPDTKKIVIGYYGSHASWVDFELISKIANYRPDRYTVVMIGRDNVYNLKIDDNNIYWIDHKSYDILPNYLKYFDICMIPFKLTEMIKGCDPIKFYEYLAAGKPIITTKMDPIVKYENVCHFINHNNYGKIIDSIKIKNKIEDRLQVAKNNSWDIKAKYIIDNLFENIDFTVLYPQYIRWDKMYQRPQQMMKALSKIKGVRSVFIDYSINNDKVIDKNLVLTPTYKSAKKYLKGKIIVYFNNPKLINDISSYKYDISIFELVDKPVDEFSNWQKDLNCALKNSNYIFLTSPELKIYPKKFNLPYSILPNGADYEHFYKAKDKLQKPRDFPNTYKYIIGYYGAHATWVDWDLIKKIADISRIHVVMIGKMKQIYDYSFEHNNITWLPIKPYQELPNYLSWFDICMIPFKLTDMIKACDPIKLYEFSAAGKPVVATNMEELQKFDDVCYFMNHQNYKKIIQKAISEKDDPNLILKRQDMAKNNTWSSRADTLIRTIK